MKPDNLALVAFFLYAVCIFLFACDNNWLGMCLSIVGAFFCVLFYRTNNYHK